MPPPPPHDELVDVARLAWPEFMAQLDWRQGEHVALVGPTGQGKTTLALELVERRKWAAIVATKPRDATLNGLRRKGWEIIRRWPPAVGRRRAVLWVPIKNMASDPPRARAVVAEALQAMYDAGAWCIVLDDLQALLQTLGLGRIVSLLLLNARSLGLSVVASTQRPRWVPREVWTQSTHLFVWGTGDADDLRSLGGLGTAHTQTIRATVASLERHDVLYVNTRTGALVVTRVERR